MYERDLSTDEIVAITTLNCCANAIEDNLPKLARRLTPEQLETLKQAGKAVAETVRTVVEAEPDEDHQAMILTRMSRLKLQFGAVRKHPEELVIMTVEDAQTLLAPVLDRCDIDCPCVSYDEDGDKTVSRMLVRRCETRKALKRIGLSEVGLSMDCPYQMTVGGR